MDRFDIRDMKKQASFYFREKVKSARLAFTDVSRIQLLAEEATNADPWGPETRTMAMLSDAAFELEEYDRIVQVLHSRLEQNAKSPWRQLFKTLTVLEYLLTHGPGSLSNEFKADTVCIEELCHYNFLDQQGIDRGVSIRNKADHVLELLSKADLWKEERSRAQKISHGIRGFGTSIDRANVAVRNEENLHTKSNEPEPKDAESESFLSNETSQEGELKVTSGVNWQPFEKCTSIPSYLRHEDERSPSNDNISASGFAQWKTPELSPFKKCLSSPSHFRDTSQSAWQAFSSDTNAENIFGSDHTEKTHETEDPIFLQASNDRVIEATPEVTPSGEVLLVNPLDRRQLDKVTQPPHLSMRRLFGFHKPIQEYTQKNAKEYSTSENHHTKDERAIAIDEITVAEALQTPSQHVSVLKESVKPSDLPILPPPPRSKFRTEIQHQFQPSNLIDL